MVTGAGYGSKALTPLLSSLVNTQVPYTQMKVFRGTLVHCRVPEKIEILPDHLIGFDDARQGEVRTREEGGGVHCGWPWKQGYIFGVDHF